MATTRVTWLDLESGTYVERAELAPGDVGGSAKGYRITKQRLHGGLSDGVDVVHVNNGAFSFSVLPTRGMSVWKAWSGPDLIGWNSPVRGPVHPKFVPLMEPGGLGWLDGFDELLVRCGLESNGAPEFDEETGRLKYPLHGRIGNKPAHHLSVAVDGDSGEITLTGVVEESRFHFGKLRMTTVLRTKVGEPGFRIEDTVENFSAGPGETQMLYHVNFGPPVLDAGARFVAPLKTVVPRNDHAATGIASWSSYAAPEPGFAEQVYFLNVLGDKNDNSRALLKNAHGTKGVSLLFNIKQLPCFTVWKNTTALADGCVTGLEPGTNFPNPRSYEGKQGRVVKLAPGKSVRYELGLEFHATAGQVEAAERAIAALQGATQPHVFDKPQEGWCSP